MPRRKKTILALPDQVGKDAQTMAGILDKWAGQAEDVAKDAFAWAKKHKILVLLAIGVFMFYRYWLVEPNEEEVED